MSVNLFIFSYFLEQPSALLYFKGFANIKPFTFFSFKYDILT